MSKTPEIKQVKNFQEELLDYARILNYNSAKEPLLALDQYYSDAESLISKKKFRDILETIDPLEIDMDDFKEIIDIFTFSFNKIPEPADEATRERFIALREERKAKIKELIEKIIDSIEKFGGLEKFLEQVNTIKANTRDQISDVQVGGKHFNPKTGLFEEKQWNPVAKEYQFVITPKEKDK